jgi:hypothetical protein
MSSINLIILDEEYKLKGRNSSVGIATGWMAGVRFPEIFEYLYSIVSRPALGPAQRPIQWVLRALSPEAKRQEVKVTTHLHLVPRSRIRGAMPPMTYTLSRRGVPLKVQG